MKTRRLRLARPKWTLGTMLLIVGWSAVAVWLNVRPRVHDGVEDTYLVDLRTTYYFVTYGFPWTVATRLCFHEGSSIRIESAAEFEPSYRRWPLAANIAIGLVAVAVLTLASKYLLRAILSGLRRLFAKPTTGNEKGHQEPR